MPQGLARDSGARAEGGPAVRAAFIAWDRVRYDRSTLCQTSLLTSASCLVPAAIFMAHQHWVTGAVYLAWAAASVFLSQPLGRPCMQMAAAAAATVAVHWIEGGLWNSGMAVATAVAAPSAPCLPSHETALAGAGVAAAVCITVGLELGLCSSGGCDSTYTPMPDRALIACSAFNLLAGRLNEAYVSNRLYDQCRRVLERAARFDLFECPAASEATPHVVARLLDGLVEDLKEYRKYLPDHLFEASDGDDGSADDIVDDNLGSIQTWSDTSTDTEDDVTLVLPSYEVNAERNDAAGVKPITLPSRPESPSPQPPMHAPQPVATAQLGLRRISAGAGPLTSFRRNTGNLMLRKVAVVGTNVLSTSNMMQSLTTEEFVELLCLYHQRLEDNCRTQVGTVHHVAGDRALVGFNTAKVIAAAQLRAAKFAFEVSTVFHDDVLEALKQHRARAEGSEGDSLSTPNTDGAGERMRTLAQVVTRIASVSRNFGHGGVTFQDSSVRKSGGGEDVKKKHSLAAAEQILCTAAVCSGEALVGLVGSKQHRSVQVVGWPVRAAARLVDRAKVLFAGALCDGGTAVQVAHEIMAAQIDLLNVFGRRVKLFHLVHGKEPAGESDDEWMYQVCGSVQLLDSYKEAFQDFQEGRYLQASDKLGRLVSRDAAARGGAPEPTRLEATLRRMKTRADQMSVGGQGLRSLGASDTLHSIILPPENTAGGQRIDKSMRKRSCRMSRVFNTDSAAAFSTSAKSGEVTLSAAWTT